MPANDNDAEIEAFYDGDCSLCSREVSWLRSRDRNGHIRFTNIAAPEFDADRDAGIPVGRLQKCIQARLATGEVVEGVEVFRHLYRIVGSNIVGREPNPNSFAHRPALCPAARRMGLRPIGPAGNIGS